MIEVPEQIYYSFVVLAVIGAWQVGQWVGMIVSKLFAKTRKSE